MTKKWTSWDFVQLRKLYRNGESMQHIAKTLRSTSSTVSAYISNEISFGRLKNRKLKNRNKVKDPLDEIFVKTHKKKDHYLDGVSLKDEIRLLRTYLYNKMGELEKTMKGLLEYCREDLERLDKISKLIDKKNKQDGEKE